jgi:small subunit ribosomal protein S24e
MRTKILNQQRNELLKRDELSFHIDHEGTGTPSRIEVRQKLADVLDAEEERIFLSKFETKTGSTTTIGEANLYDSVEQAKYVEPEHIIARNTPKKLEEGVNV